MAKQNAAFQLDPTLAADTVWLGDLPLSRVLLAKESRYPWLILVPRRAGVKAASLKVERYIFRRGSQPMGRQFMAVSSGCRIGAGTDRATGPA